MPQPRSLQTHDLAARVAQVAITLARSWSRAQILAAGNLGRRPLPGERGLERPTIRIRCESAVVTRSWAPWPVCAIRQGPDAASEAHPSWHANCVGERSAPDHDRASRDVAIAGEIATG